MVRIVGIAGAAVDYGVIWSKSCEGVDVAVSVISD